MEDSIRELIDIVETIGQVGDNRHNELMVKLSSLVGILNKPAVEVKEVDLTKLESVIASLKPEPVDNSELKGIAKSINFTINLILNMIEEIKNKKQPSKLQVVRTSEGVIDFVNIEYNNN